MSQNHPLNFYLFLLLCFHSLLAWTTAESLPCLFQSIVLANAWLFFFFKKSKSYQVSSFYSLCKTLPNFQLPNQDMLKSKVCVSGPAWSGFCLFFQTYFSLLFPSLHPLTNSNTLFVFIVSILIFIEHL